MPWVRISDDFPQHPKLAQVGPLGLALQVAGLCYANHYLTDGRIPKGAAMTLLNFDRIGINGADITPWQIISELLAAGIWEEVDGGYQIHDFLDFQPSRADVMAERQKTATRVKQLRNRRSNAVSNDSSNGSVTASPGPVPVPGTQYPVPNPEPRTAKAVVPKPLRGKAAAPFSGDFLSLFSDHERADLSSRHPGVDLVFEAQKCWTWWSEGKKKLQRPKAAYLNWLSRSHPSSNGSRPPQDASMGSSDPRKFFKGKFGHVVQS